MIVLDDLTGEAAALAARLHARLAELGVYRPEPRRGSRTSPCCGSATARGSIRPCPRREHSFRPVLLLTYRDCTRPAPGTRCSNASR